MTIVGVLNGYFKDNERIVETINAAQPQPLLVALGFPREEVWIVENLPHLNVNAAIGEGGSFSFISGTTPRAPRWLRRLVLESLFRLLGQTWRLR